jgi:hypothetical protein
VNSPTPTECRVETAAPAIPSPKGRPSRDKFDRADVTDLPPIAVAIDATLTQLIPARAHGPVSGIDRRAVRQEWNVPVGALRSQRRFHHLSQPFDFERLHHVVERPALQRFACQFFVGVPGDHDDGNIRRHLA